MQNEMEDIIKEDISRTSSAFISTLHGRESSATFGEFEFYFGLEQLREQIQETPLSHTPNPPPRTKKTKPHERKNNPGVFNWTLQNPDVNSIQEYEIERDIRRQAQGRKRDSVLRRMEKILEDGGDRGVVYRGVSRDEDGEEEEELWDMDGGDSREWSWGEDAREKCSNPKRRIKSSARITRKGTFGEGFREKSAVLQDEERTSLRGHSFSSRDFDRSDRDGDGRGRVERSRCVDMGTSTCGLTSGEECGAEEGDTAAGGVGTSVRVRGKHLRKEENDFEYENCKEREREQVCSGSRMSSFISTVIDEEDIEEEEDLQDKDEDIDFDIGPPKRERLPDPRTDTRSATNSRIPIEYLKSRRPVSRKMTARNATSDYFEIDEDTRRRKN
ncbi:hypothetical protein BPOR_1038g00030 [Botrytis porri]|uniref:Uncharacterized protein n=1 Tax=Botrytis porri TaxID=87229 RepID=A0A4Z1KE05_9HELO|nr:hypothetical protein BPOR_1038g00030 [Botrytis porri]